MHSRRKSSSSIVELEHLLEQGRDVEIKPDGTVVVDPKREKERQPEVLTRGKNLGDYY